jgi:hypothetical protein
MEVSYLLGGTSTSDSSGEKSEASRGSGDYWVVKIDSVGNKFWDKTYGGNGGDGVNTMITTSDGGFLLGGFSRSDISGDKSEASRGGSDYWILKIDQAGNPLWDKTLGGDAIDYLWSLVATFDGGYLLGGLSQSEITGEKSETSRGDFDYWVVKLGPETVPSPGQYRINAGGGEYTTVYNQEYQADAYFQGGVVSTPVTTPVAGTGDAYVYRNGRHGAAFSYTLPIRNGEYDVVLHFAETWWGNLAPGGVGSRRFNVDMEGQRKLTEYDIFQKAGGALRAVKETFRVEVKDGVLNLLFTKGSADLASIKAIELTRHTPGARVAVAPEATSSARLFPNPVGTTLAVQLSFPVREIKATAIRNVRGRTLLINAHKPVGEHLLQVEVSLLPRGAYLLHLQSGHQEQVLKFIKQ